LEEKRIVRDILPRTDLTEKVIVFRTVWTTKGQLNRNMKRISLTVQFLTEKNILIANPGTS
jgi:hypothetical protein